MTLNEEYERAKDLVELATGLELTLIEKFTLRYLVRDTMQRNERIKSPSNWCVPAGEAFYIFMRDYYDFSLFGDPHTSFNFLLRLRERDLNQGQDRVREYFRRKQEEMHKP